MTPPPPQQGRAWRPAAVALVGLWIGTGAVFKLFWGTPNDLPAPLHELPGTMGHKYALFISIELVGAWLALLRPRWGWALVVAILLAFDAVLVELLRRGEANCGCFGSRVSIDPGLMLAIDSVLLVAVLLARPWSATRGLRVPWLVLLPLLAASAAAPWIVDRSPPPAGGTNPLGSRPWLELLPDTWVGEMIFDSQLAGHLDLYSLPLDGTWVLYRETCPHCGVYMEELALRQHEIPGFLVLIRLDDAAEAGEAPTVTLKPHGPQVIELDMPRGTDWIVEVPVVLELEAGIVTSAEIILD